MNSPVETIKERLSIVDVISSYLPVQEAGKNYKAKCPFHNEKTPSFFISPDRGTYYCFGCSAKGDIFSFVQQFEGTDFLGSLKILAERAGVTLEYDRNIESRDEREKLYAIMEEATNFFEALFEKTPEARTYLRTRGLTDATIKLFRIGYAPASWKSLSDHLVSSGFKMADLEKVGLVKQGNNGFYDRFRGRIIFPINDSSGRVIAFSGRIFPLSTDVKSNIEEAKYLNSPDTPLFNKSNVLFGIDKAKAAIRTRSYSIVVEGQMDLILSHQALFSNTVAVSGTALADNINDESVSNESKINNLGLIRRISPNIIFAFDGDSAGIRAAGRSAMIALSLDMQVKIAVLPEGQDPADIILGNPDTWKDIIKNSVNIVSFHIDRICKGTNDIRLRGKQIREIVFPFLSMVTSSIERSAYINEIYKKTGLTESSLIEDFDKYERTLGTSKVSHVEEKKQDNLAPSRRDNLERRLFGIIFWQKDKGEESEKIKELIESFENRIGKETFKKILSVHEPFSDTLAIESEMWYVSKTDTLYRDTKELTLNLEEELLNEQKVDLQPLDTDEKITNFNNISKRIEEIKKERSL